MRKVNFKVRNIGSEKYLSYVLGDDVDFDEELLDYLDDNKLPELIDIIYEEDDENDYLTYNVTGRATVGSVISGGATAEMVLGILRSAAAGIINMRDLGIPVAYVVLNKEFTYVNPVTYDVKLLCIPVESDISLNLEFKNFVKDVILSSTYAENEDCNYVAKLINMLNVEKFTIRGFVGQLTELMNAAGMDVEEDFMEVGDGDVAVSQSVVDTKEASLDDLPEFTEVDLSAEDDDLDDMYDDEPAEGNTIFKDLDLDEPHPSTVEEAIEHVNMDAFDEDALEELEIEELPEEPVEMATEVLTEDMTEESAEEEETPAPEPAPEPVPEKKPEMSAEVLGMIAAVKKATEQEKNGEPVDITHKSEPTLEELAAAAAAVAAGKPNPFKEVGKTADGVTEVVKTGDGEDGKPEIIDTADMSNIPAAAPAKKSLRVNRAKIIQSVADEVEENTEIDNPTEAIAGGVEGLEPEAITTPVAEDDKKDEPSADGVEVTPGVNVVKEAEPEKQAPAATGPKAMPYIVRVNTGERVMVNKAVFKLGKANRGVDFHISGNGAISKVHAIIYQRDLGCYLKDNKATNPTMVDGQTVGESQEVKLKHDSTITIGGEDFIFKLS